ncbi:MULTISPECIES: cytochrome c6 PetJ [Cyanophyceae]|uniref:cytochrome c6 PetJ n=1 Tax=Cyanophyceae TaxID=3028117 RepID=UPI00232BCC33|nr:MULTISPECIES: c-type cytochrome [Cyanophyceae]MDB9355429.1 c-type cytochrome [Nodularia spumigena CS-587/03]MDB9306375.1 c-type cytochrome [Nodularia spumigena CS-591/12]MDB9317959.1 c-type cytochrome [Nodularia spumigena CS-590/01A]MDB9322831.1 c-type cytochrome [Nodularia spumigena CS-591/07A]MDB9328095.1 c-type cytochrome [Nodularia spumigena CS-590/02]
MKRIISLLLLGITIFTFTFSSPALAADTVNGAKIFSANCAACHAGGRNLVQAQKTLKKDALEKYGLYSEAAIISQVTNGKNAMPAFKGRLKSEQIENVAAYVLEQADKGW